MPWWGGSSKPDDTSSSSSSGDDASPSGTSFVPDTPSFNTSTLTAPSGTKAALVQQIQQESALQNARALVTSINQNCYERCVPKPGSSLSRGEENCFTMCMEKYMNTWNAVSRAYIARLQQQNQQRQGLGGGGLGM